MVERRFERRTFFKMPVFLLLKVIFRLLLSTMYEILIERRPYGLPVLPRRRLFETSSSEPSLSSSKSSGLCSMT